MRELYYELKVLLYAGPPGWEYASLDQYRYTISQHP